MKKRVIEKKNGFRCMEWKHGNHRSQTLRVWVNKRVPLQQDEDGDMILEFPVKGTEIQATEKGTLVLRPVRDSFKMVYLYEMPSGYRGNAGVTAVEHGEMVQQIKVYHSQRGSLGETAVCLINGRVSGVLVHWRRSGRRVDRTEGATWLYGDGSEVDAWGEGDDLEEMLE
jgi:hypothetical protein